MLALGAVLGVGLGVSGVLLLDQEPRFRRSNGVLSDFEQRAALWRRDAREDVHEDFTLLQNALVEAVVER